jgi:ABC-type transport system involved in multi-copper enzyme maturation permease subunit
MAEKPAAPALVIAGLTFREAARRKILLAALVLGAAFLAVYGLGFGVIQRNIGRRPSGPPGLLELNEIRSFLLMAGLYVVNFLTVMMAVLTSVDTLAGEIASGTIHTLAAKPVRRWEIVMGKWLGFAGMLTLYVVLMAGGVVGVVYGLSGYAAPHALRGLGLMWLNVLLLLSVSLLGGATLSTLANGVLVFGLFGVAFIGGWIEHVGSFLHNEAAIRIGIVSSLALPSEALWRRAAHEMESPLVRALGFSPFASGSVPSGWMIAYAVVYTAAALLLATRRFARRDL